MSGLLVNVIVGIACYCAGLITKPIITKLISKVS